METLAKKVVAVGAGSLLAVSGVATAATTLADAYAVDQNSAADVSAAEGTATADIVRLSEVAGEFDFTQTEVASNADLKTKIAAASKYLCGAHGDQASAESALEDWTIEVKGAVKESFEFRFEDFENNGAMQKLILGCSCGGNGVDGISTANAEVTGVPALNLLEYAGIEDDANTVVFTSADGYEVALPLEYLYQHYCPIVYNVNGSPIEESMGGVNQLWLGATSANYFARDVVAITIECREVAPANPISDEARAAYQNLPNIGILLGGEIR